MPKVLLISHGRLASGLCNTLSFFAGDKNDLMYVDAYVDETDSHLDKLDSFLSNVHENEKAIIFTDILGGSVSQDVLKRLSLCKGEIIVITNMNLPIVLSILMETEELNKKKIDELLTNSSPCQISLDVEGKKECGVSDEAFWD